MHIQITVEADVTASKKELTEDMALWCIRNLYFRPENVVEKELNDYGNVKIEILDRRGKKL